MKLLQRKFPDLQYMHACTVYNIIMPLKLWLGFICIIFTCPYDALISDRMPRPHSQCVMSLVSLRRGVQSRPWRLLVRLLTNQNHPLLQPLCHRKARCHCEYTGILIHVYLHCTVSV